MNNTVLFIGKSESCLSALADLDLEVIEISADKRIEIFNRLAKIGVQISGFVAVCCTDRGCFETLLRHKQEINPGGRFVIVRFRVDSMNFDDFQNYVVRELPNAIAENCLPVPVFEPEVLYFKMRSELPLVLDPKIIVGEGTRLPSDREFFVPRSMRILSNNNSSTRNFVQHRKILRRGESVQNLDRFFLIPFFLTAPTTHAIFMTE